MLRISDYISAFAGKFPELENHFPWDIPASLGNVLTEKIKNLPPDYQVKGNIAIHKTAIIETNVVLKGPLIIGPHCFVASNGYIRNGVYFDANVTLGPGCEVKSSIIFSSSNLAHFSFVGDSLLGEGVNLEAGAVIANHWNERKIKEITVSLNGKIINTGVDKFGTLAGDGTRVGANAVLSPGTILAPGTIVDRLQHIRQS